MGDTQKLQLLVTWYFPGLFWTIPVEVGMNSSSVIEAGSSILWGLGRQMLPWLGSDLLGGPAALGGPVGCSDCRTDTDTYGKEHSLYPQPVAREGVRPGTPSTREPSGSGQEPPRSTGTMDGSHFDCRGAPYPSNHDRMLTWKQQPGASREGKGNLLQSPRPC